MVLIEFPLAKRHHLPFHLPKKLKFVKVGKNFYCPAVVLRPLPVSEAFRDESEIAK